MDTFDNVARIHGRATWKRNATATREVLCFFTFQMGMFQKILQPSGGQFEGNQSRSSVGGESRATWRPFQAAASSFLFSFLDEILKNILGN